MHEIIRLFFCGASLSFAAWGGFAGDIDPTGSDVEQLLNREAVKKAIGMTKADAADCRK